MYKRQGLDIDKFGPQLSFFFNAHNDLLTEVAKFRAARRLWAKIMKNRFGAKNEKSMLCRFHAQTGGSTLSAQQVDNNIVRTTIQALSAVLGGTQSLHTNAFDEALALPTDNSAKLALRTQQIIAHESGVTNFIDPLGGSAVVEELTDKLENDAQLIIEEIDSLGGAIQAINQGWIQNQISKSAYDYQQSIDNQKQKIVGVNSFVEDEDSMEELQSIDQNLVTEQIKQVHQLKTTRDNNAVQLKLDQLKSIADSKENLMPAIIEACRNKCTLGEISDALRECFGEFT